MVRNSKMLDSADSNDSSVGDLGALEELAAAATTDDKGSSEEAELQSKPIQNALNRRKVRWLVVNC